MNYAKRKACMENITLITGKNYITVVLIFSVINCIASFASFMSMYATYYFTYIPVCSIFTVLSALVEYFIARTVVFKKFSFDKKEKNKRALSFICICAPYYIFIVNAPLFLYPIAFTLDPC